MPDGLIPKGSAIGSFGKRNGPGLTQRLWVTFRLGTSSAACRPAHSILTKPWCTEGVVEVRGERFLCASPIGSRTSLLTPLIRALTKNRPQRGPHCGRLGRREIRGGARGGYD